MNKITSFQQIKDIIEPIPKEEFCELEYENKNGQCCVLGHIQKAISGSAKNDLDGYGARALSKQFLRDKHNIQFGDISSINNSPDVNGYTEPEIKDRLMHAIEDGIKWENEKKVS